MFCFLKLIYNETILFRIFSALRICKNISKYVKKSCGYRFQFNLTISNLIQKYKDRSEEEKTNATLCIGLWYYILTLLKLTVYLSRKKLIYVKRIL